MKLMPMNSPLRRFVKSHPLARYFSLLCLHLIICLMGCDKQTAKSYEQTDTYVGTMDARTELDHDHLDAEVVNDQLFDDMSLSDSDVLDIDMEAPLEPLVMPELNERAFIETTTGLIVVWRVNQQLYRVQLTEEAINNNEELLIAEAEPWIDLPESHHSKPIHLSALPSYPPYFLIESEAEESLALRADLSNPDLVHLGLQNDLLFAVGDGGALVLGSTWEEPVTEENMEEEDSQNTASTINKVLSWQFVRDGEWSGLKKDLIGVPSAASLARGLGSWILATDQGQCFMLNEQIGLHHAWHCHSHANTSLISNDFEVKVIGSLSRSAEDEPRGLGLWLWSGTPGRSMNPLALTVQTQADRSSNQLAIGDVLSLKDGLLDRWLIRSESPQILMSQDESEWAVITEQGEYTFAHLNAQHIFGLIHLKKSRPSLIKWDVIEAGLSIQRLNESEWTPWDFPSVAPEDELCLVSPERCDPIDHDCDGQNYNQLCCLQGESVTSRLNSVLFPKYDWFTGDSEIGALAMIASQGAARLFSFSTNGGEATLRAQWNGIESLSHFSNYLSLVSAIALDENGQSYLVQNRRVNEEWFKLALPCDPLALSVLDANHSTRIYCEDKSLLFNIDSEEPIEETYPESSPVQWMTAWKTGNENLGEHYWLVALGEYNQLSLWKGDLDQIVLGESETLFLPSTLGWLTSADRVLPIQLPMQGLGLISRVINSAQVEVWMDQIGWTRLGGHRWPLWASLSPNQAIAISVGYDEDPSAVQDSFLQRVNVRLHSLQEDSVYFGELTKEKVSKDSFGGAHLANYDSQNGTRPNLIHLLAGSLELSNAVCDE